MNSNPLTLIDYGREALNLYVKTIGVEYNSKARHFKHTQPRIAFGVALTKHIGDSLTSDVLEKDRTTIIHYKRKHADNMELWDGYDTLFETAKYIIDSYFSETAKLDRIAYIDRMIRQMVEEKKSIQSNTNV